MGAQTMGSNGGTQKPMLDGSSRKGSLYNLTLDELQQQLGDLEKPISSMNVDELLKCVQKAESNQGTSRKIVKFTKLTKLDLGFKNKTVDEAWQDIQQDLKKKKKIVNDTDSDTDTDNDSISRGGSCKSGDRKKQSSLGEMTLEDFFIKERVVAESSDRKKHQEQSLDPTKAQWINHRIPAIQQQNTCSAGHYLVQQPVLVTGNRVMDVGYVSPTPLMGTLSNTRMSGKKRFASGDVMEKVVERKQNRMIKNRESAARSRDRKQAYTRELEEKVARLEEENERLRRQKEVEKIIPWVPPAKPKYQLRRTTSAPF